MAINLEAIRKRVEQLQNGNKYNNVPQFKPKKAGEYHLRVLPWPAKFVSPDQPFVERYFYYIGDNYATLAPFQFDKPDPIKELVDAFYSSGKPDEKALAKKLRPGMTAYAPVVVKKGEGSDPDKVVLWAIPKLHYAKMLSWFLDEDIGDYTDPKEGFNVKVTAIDNGKKFKDKTVFNLDVELGRSRTRLADTDEKINSLLESIPDPNDLHELKDASELEKMLRKWLDGDPLESSDGTERGSASKSSETLDELASDIKSTPVAKSAEKEKSSKKKEKQATEEPAQSLDDAFDELMKDSDE